MSEAAGKIAETLMSGKIDEVKKITQEALDNGVDPRDIVDNGLIAGMDIVGQRWKANEMFIPEVLRCAKAMGAGMEIVRPKLSDSDTSGTGVMVIGTVEGDLHDIGKDLVAMMFEGAGFKVVNIGIDQPSQKFVDAVKEHKPQLLGISALLTTTMPKMGEVINALKEAGIRDQVKIMVGGAPVTEDYAEEIGADGYGANAAHAVERGKELVRAA
jgi:corrinoid protein of di/trimethylamine methyltransferase